MHVCILTLPTIILAHLKLTRQQLLSVQLPTTFFSLFSTYHQLPIFSQITEALRERVEDFSNLYWDTQMVRNNRWLSCFSRGTPAVSYLVKPGGVYKCLFWIEALHSLGVPQREGALALGSCNMKFGCHV